MRRFQIAAAVAAVAFAAHAAPLAAQPAPGKPMSPDEFAAEAARSDAYEVQSGQLAQTKAASPMVKQMGAMLVKDHTMTTNKLMDTLTALGRPMNPPGLDARRRTMIDQLAKADGAAFDRLFTQQQITAHQEALALHTGYSQNGTVPQLKTVASDAATVVQGHLQHLQSHAGH
ncbi:DUF4142 domain-containing protein [Phenylobacterium sp. VNQ135]|uniref:DUF4142 domain-containing protein n=1 Tax=Phenylobacterium sp. VNQ135 TaxID=3400922 RepID=UPI003C036E7A